MIEYLPGIKKVAFRVLWVSLVITILLLLRYNKTYFENKFTISLNGTICLNNFDSKNNLLTFSYQFYDNYGYDEAIYGNDLDIEILLQVTYFKKVR